jgi:DNA-binding NtrC family response regulator
MNAIEKQLLIIDDDRLLCDAVREAVVALNVEVTVAHCAADGLALCKSKSIDIVLLDQKLPDADGMDYCEPILKCRDHTKIIFITAYPSFENAVQAIKIGAYDYLSKPFEVGELRLAVTQAIRTLDLEQIEQVQQYKSKQESDHTILVGHQGGLRQVRRLVDLAAGNHAPVLITGETGTGKTLAAKAVHYSAGNTGLPFIGVNCAAIPENLMEAELFGYEKGAFTGAVAAKKGIFEMAAGGTLFLDEIGEIPRHLQSKLLGVLDDHQIKRLGGQSFKPVQVRVVAATNADLEKAIQGGQFREDLFYRLGVVRIHVPALRERIGDLPDLCHHFIHKIAPDHPVVLDPSELLAMSQYAWPGNVRELRNVIERAILVRQGRRIHPSHLLGTDGAAVHATNHSNTKPYGSESVIMTLKELEADHICRTLNRLDNNYTHTAKALGVSRSTLMRKIKSFQLN